MSAPNNEYQQPQPPPQLQPGQRPNGNGNGNGFLDSLFSGDKKKFLIGAGVAVAGMLLLQNAFQDGVQTGIMIARNGGEFPRGGYGYGPHIGPWFFILGVILFVAWRKGKFGNHGGPGGFGHGGPGGWMGGPGGRQPWRNSAPWGQPSYPPTPPAAPTAPAQNWQETRVPVTPTPETQTNSAAAAAPTSPSSTGPDSPTGPQPMEYRRSAGAPDDQAPTVW